MPVDLTLTLWADPDIVLSTQSQYVEVSNPTSSTAWARFYGEWYPVESMPVNTEIEAAVALAEDLSFELMDWFVGEWQPLDMYSPGGVAPCAVCEQPAAWLYTVQTTEEHHFDGFSKWIVLAHFDNGWVVNVAESPEMLKPAIRTAVVSTVGWNRREGHQRRPLRPSINAALRAQR